MRTQAMSKPRGEGPSLPFSIAPQVLPWCLFVTMPILACPSLEASYPSLANWSGTGPRRVKKGQRWWPFQGSKICLLSGLWSQGRSLSLSHGGYSFWNQAGWLPTMCGPTPRVYAIFEDTLYLFCLLFSPQCLAQCLLFSRHSINKCSVNK